MDSLDDTVNRIRAVRNARNVFREDPVLNDDDLAYRAGILRSTREFPGYVGTPRKGRSLPPGLNPAEYLMLEAIFGKEGGEE